MARVFKSHTAKINKASKLCTCCKKSKPITEFSTRLGPSKTGPRVYLVSHCRACRNLQEAQRTDRATKANTRSNIPEDDARIHRMFYEIKKRHNNKSPVPFAVRFNELKEIVMRPCTYCFRTNLNRGIDRMLNDAAYEKNNMLACCGTCNRLKTDLPLDVWIEMLSVLRKHIQTGKLDKNTYAKRCKKTSLGHVISSKP